MLRGDPPTIKSMTNILQILWTDITPRYPINMEDFVVVVHFPTQ
jgi:hypothetical protein